MRLHAGADHLSGYGVRHYRDLPGLYASLMEEDAGGQSRHGVWDKILGLGTMALISICGWAVIIEIARLLR